MILNKIADGWLVCVLGEKISKSRAESATVVGSASFSDRYRSAIFQILVSCTLATVAVMMMPVPTRRRRVIIHKRQIILLRGTFQATFIRIPRFAGAAAAARLIQGEWCSRVVGTLLPSTETRFDWLISLDFVTKGDLKLPLSWSEVKPIRRQEGKKSCGRMPKSFNVLIMEYWNRLIGFFPPICR